MPRRRLTERDLLLEVARLTAALLLVIRRMDDPELKAEVADIIWPRDKAKGSASMNVTGARGLARRLPQNMRARIYGWGGMAVPALVAAGYVAHIAALHAVAAVVGAAVGFVARSNTPRRDDTWNTGD